MKEIVSPFFRLEIGVQSVYEDVARDTNRGHTVRAVCESFHQSKDAGFKVGGGGLLLAIYFKILLELMNTVPRYLKKNNLTCPAIWIFF